MTALDDIDATLQNWPDHWRRFTFCWEQLGHAWINLWAEAFRHRFNAPKLGKFVGLVLTTMALVTLTTYAIYGFSERCG